MNRELGSTSAEPSGEPAALHARALEAYSGKKLRLALDLAVRAVAMSPGSAPYLNTLGIIRGDLEDWDACLSAFRSAIRLDPAYFDAHRNLAVALRKARRAAEALTPLRRAAELRPADAGIWSLRAWAHHARLDLAGAIACRRRALDLNAADPYAHSQLLATLNYSADYSADQLLEEHVAWSRRHEAPVRDRFPGGPFENLRDPSRTLRIGYVSGDFRDHPVSRFFYPLLDSHDRGRNKSFCYSDVARADEQTERLRKRADVWRDISAMDDDSVAAAIRADQIDVLVDLAGHLDNRRLLVFARRPAPVQATYIGYPNTTGMGSMDYRLTDVFHDPPGTDAFHTERLIRLERCCVAYDVGDDPPDVNAVPAARTGRITFALFNRLIKATPAMARLWSRILERVPGSRILVVDSAHAGEASLRAALGRLGLTGDIGILPRSKTRQEYLARYRTVDIALDTFPYAGMTTTCDAMWMGVPTVTLAGKTHVSRSGVSLMSAVELTDLIAKTPEEYVEIAVRLASDLSGLAALRSGLRERMRRSPLCAGPGLARAIEAAYREMYREFLAGRETEQPEDGAAATP